MCKDCFVDLLLFYVICCFIRWHSDVFGMLPSHYRNLHCNTKRMPFTRLSMWCNHRSSLCRYIIKSFLVLVCILFCYCFFYFLSAAGLTLKDMTKKTCVLPEMCRQDSVNFGAFQIVRDTKCCKFNNCNSELPGNTHFVHSNVLACLKVIYFNSFKYWSLMQD